MVCIESGVTIRCSLGKSFLAKVWKMRGSVSACRWLMMGTYTLVGAVADLLAHQCVHPLHVLVVVVAAYAGHVGGYEGHFVGGLVAGK